MMPSSLWVDWRLGFMAAHPALFRIKTVKPQLSPGYPLRQVGWQDILERLCAPTSVGFRRAAPTMTMRSDPRCRSRPVSGTYSSVTGRPASGMCRARHDRDADTLTDVPSGPPASET
jgi:hypothetical protein